VNGVLHGASTYFYPDGSRLVGFWHLGDMQRAYYAPPLPRTHPLPEEEPPALVPDPCCVGVSMAAVSLTDVPSVQESRCMGPASVPIPSACATSASAPMHTRELRRRTIVFAPSEAFARLVGRKRGRGSLAQPAPSPGKHGPELSSTTGEQDEKAPLFTQVFAFDPPEGDVIAKHPLLEDPVCTGEPKGSFPMRTSHVRPVGILGVASYLILVAYPLVRSNMSTHTHLTHSIAHAVRNTSRLRCPVHNPGRQRRALREA